MMANLASDLFMHEKVATTFAKAKAVRPLAEKMITKARKELRESIISIAPIFSEKPFFMNEDFTLVDCCVVPILWRLKHVGISLPERSTRPLQKYMQMIFERESFRESLSETELEMHE